MKKRLVSSAAIGNAGEYFVQAELTRRGWTATLAARNSRAFDILAKRGEQNASIRVKTKTSAFKLFQWNAKANGEIFLEMTPKQDFCALVDIPEEGAQGPTYYIVPTPIVDKWLKDDFNMWVTTPGAKGQQRAEDNKRRIFYVDDEPGKLSHGYKIKLSPYLGAWHLLG
jgi:hypothetical protein